MKPKQNTNKTKKVVSQTSTALADHILIPISDQISLENLKYTHRIEYHKLKMEQLNYMRESETIHNEHKITRQRTKSSEIEKTQQRKEAAFQARGYSKDFGWKK